MTTLRSAYKQFSLILAILNIAFISPIFGANHEALEAVERLFRTYGPALIEMKPEQVVRFSENNKTYWETSHSVDIARYKATAAEEERKGQEVKSKQIEQNKELEKYRADLLATAAREHHEYSLKEMAEFAKQLAFWLNENQKAQAQQQDERLMALEEKRAKNDLTARLATVERENQLKLENVKASGEQRKQFEQQIADIQRATAQAQENAAQAQENAAKVRLQAATVEIKAGEQQHARNMEEEDKKATNATNLEKQKHENKLAQDKQNNDARAQLWDKAYNFVSDPKKMAVVVGAIGVTIGLYYGLPVATRYLEARLSQPKIVGKTSKKSFFGSSMQQIIDLRDYVMNASMQNRLLSIVERISNARINDEKLFNLLMVGEPGTGKSMFIQGLALASGLDYAIISGSEFAKITDTNLAISELHKLIDWARTSTKGVIIFIDEAESFLADRSAPTTPKWSRDLLNAFLAAVPDATDKKIMFAFATNYPHMIDTAVLSRVGEMIESELPDAQARIKILNNRLAKKKISFEPQLEGKLADMLSGFSQRDIAYIAEKMQQYLTLEKKQHPGTKDIVTAGLAEKVIAEQQAAKEKQKQWQNQQRQWKEQAAK